MFVSYKSINKPFCSLRTIHLKYIFKTNYSTNTSNIEHNQIKQLNIESKHLPSIIKQLLLSIESRLSSLSSSEEIFNDSVTPYQDALNKLKY